MNVQCELCPRRCIVAPGERGDCRIRVNLDGRLAAVTYGYPCSVHVDPVEKKPVFHFLPGTQTLSLATVGCNLHCKNCQNWEISQRNPEETDVFELLPEAVCATARRYDCPSISFTYTDPVVFYEYTLDTCIKAHETGLKTILVTAGYINREPARELFRYVDAARFDLKAMTDEFYRDVCGATLQPVLDAIVLAKSMGLAVEVVHLVIPTLNDRDADLLSLSRWVAQNLGRDTPLHFSAFHPQYRLKNLPPTPAATLLRAREIARSEGLNYVYLGNILQDDAGNTLCPACGKLIIRRMGFSVLENQVGCDGKCPFCSKEIAGVWK